MSQLVSDFLINPVLRQARRLSEISRATLVGDDESATAATQPASAVVEEDEGNEVSPPGPDSASNPDIEATPSLIDVPTSPIREEMDETPMTSPVTPEPRRDRLGFPVAVPRNGPIPEDDGMGYLRARIHSINAQDISQNDKARLIHDILLESYRPSKSTASVRISSDDETLLAHAHELSASPSGVDSLKIWLQGEGQPPIESFNLTTSDLTPTFAPIRRQSKSSGNKEPSTPPDLEEVEPTEPPLGCQHYERNVKLQCSTCEKWYSCRFCHDAVEDHNLIRKDTKHMLCMLCGTPQNASDICYKCGEISAQYYCNICKLWENRSSKPIYHCHDCGICRRGLGLGKDFFHCKTCRACITTSIESSHKCIERSTDCDCPICGEYMFTSPRPVVFMKCGHSIHKKCYDQHMRVSYKCPICNKSLANMETQFRNLDIVIQSQPMPEEFRDTKAVILCNDCSGRCTVPYHWVGLKCAICQSYNTVELQMIGGANDGSQPVPIERPPDTIQRGDNSAPWPAVITGRARNGSSLLNRRRHSSNVVETAHTIPERVARSLSPMNIVDTHFGGIDFDVDSDDNDILGFWRSGPEDDSSDMEEVESEDDSDYEGPDDGEEEEEEDDENEITLFGHR